MNPVTVAQVVTILSANNPDWPFTYANHHQLVDIAKGRITEEDLRIRVMRDLWPICNATYIALVKNNK